MNGVLREKNKIPNKWEKLKKIIKSKKVENIKFCDNDHEIIILNEQLDELLEIMKQIEIIYKE
jgi:predicted Rossmann-fold nucleotide-binding protein